MEEAPVTDAEQIIPSVFLGRERRALVKFTPKGGFSFGHTLDHLTMIGH
jgi:hypothetical protein